MHRLLLVSILFFWVGCTPRPSHQTQSKSIQMRHSAYLGKKIGLFILGAGVPYAKQVSGDQIVYAWHSQNRHLCRGIGWPEESEHWMDGVCEIRIYTRLDGRITTIYALENRAKNWSADACADFLK